jgi:hypothetical protein
MKFYCVFRPVEELHFCEGINAVNLAYAIGID